MTHEQAKQELIEMGKELHPDGEYVALSLETTVFQGGVEETIYKAYMHGFNFHCGDTWIEALAGLQKEIREKANAE